MNNGKIKVAQISQIVGLAGKVKINCFCENPDSLKKLDVYDESGEKIELEYISFVKKVVYAKIKNHNTRTSVEKYNKKFLFFDLKDLKKETEEDFFYYELIGLDVYDSKDNKNKIGQVKFVHNFGAGDIIEIAQDNNKVCMVPFSKHFVTEINLEKRFLIINQVEYV